METRQMTPFFPSTFSTTVTFVFVFENSPNSFSRGRPFGPFWSIKYLNFGQKLPIRTTHHTFSESKHAEVTKNQYYALSPVGSQKKVSAHGLLSSCYEVTKYFEKYSCFKCLFTDNFLFKQSSL